MTPSSDSKSPDPAEGERPSEESSERALAESGESHTDSGSLDSERSDGDEAEDEFLRALARIPSAPPPSVELSPGQVIGGYRIDLKLGEGGMGVVYAAVDPKLNRSVALKVLPVDIGRDRRKRFLREARSASAVDHPSIATVFAIGEDAGSIFIAMERVYGVTLREHLKKKGKPLDEDAALGIVREIAGALAKAHTVGVVHRDLKPENVMITEDGRIKILDFGLAKLRGHEETTGDDDLSELATREGRILGTPSYMSPEQAKGRSVDTRSDLFSLGVMLYEMLSGKRPFAGSTTMELLIAIDRDDYEPLSRACPGADPALEDLMARCLAKLPEDRFQSAEALLEAIAALPDVRRRARQRRSRLRAGAIAAVVVVAASIAWLWPASPPADPILIVDSAGAAPVTGEPTASTAPARLETSTGHAPPPVPSASAPTPVAPKRHPVVSRPDPLSDQK